MNIVVICYLYGSLLLYLVTGGADFGAGVVELFTPAAGKNHIREVMHRLTSPIWEADHMWLILAIVILFVGFPDVYAQISTSLFIPMTAMLLGIVGRGTSYAFRNADNSVHDKFKHTDNFIYVASSVVTPFFLGVITSAIFSGCRPAGSSFTDVYIDSWFNYFSFSAGVMTVIFCGYLAMVYTLARFPAERHVLRSRFLLLSLLFFAIVSVVAWDPVFASLLSDSLPRVIIASAIMLLTGITLYVIWRLIYSTHSKWARLFALAPVLFTVFVICCTGNAGKNTGILHLPLYINPDLGKTINILGITLIISSLLIVPALGYLLYAFELPFYKKPNNTPGPGQ
jgi:cytochrome d ubiquinol oxidase subunit II